MGEGVQTVGCILLGALFNTYLFGIVSQKYMAYFSSGRARPEERRTVKAMISLLCLFDTASTASLVYGAWSIAIVNYNNPSALLAVTPWPVCFTPIATECIAITTQMFLTSRIWRLRRSNLLVGIAIGLATASFAIGSAAAAEMLILRFQSDTHRGPHGIIGSLILAWSVLQVATDVFITGNLIFILNKTRRGLAITSARRDYGRIVDRLIQGTIQTGVLAGGWAICTLIALIAWPESDLSGTISVCQGRIYTITLLDILLRRSDSLGGKDDGTTNTMPLPQFTSAIGNITLDTAAVDPRQIVSDTSAAMVIPSSARDEGSSVSG